MAVGDWFGTFCDNLVIPTEKRSSISGRYQLITRRLNLEYYYLDSDSLHSFYGGSYGRGTAINGISDLDMLFVLPYSVYKQYNDYAGNGQSALLQAVRNSIRKTYPSSDIGADGQVVSVSFTDGITFEVVPCFLNDNNTYTYADSNGGGGWKITDPKSEIAAIASGDQSWNGNLKRLCRMIRAWKNIWNVPMGGLLIDTFAHRFLGNWGNRDKSFIYYDWMSRDFFEFLSKEDDTKAYWYAVGSNQLIYRKGNFSFKAKQCYNTALEAIEKEKDYPYTAKSKWREIYGTQYPS
jgi:hypothetical protein